MAGEYESIELLCVEILDALDDNESTLADRVDSARTLAEGLRRLARRGREFEAARDAERRAVTAAWAGRMSSN